MKVKYKSIWSEPVYGGMNCLGQSKKWIVKRLFLSLAISFGESIEIVNYVYNFEQSLTATEIASAAAASTRNRRFHLMFATVAQVIHCTCHEKNSIATELNTERNEITLVMSIRKMREREI